MPQHSILVRIPYILASLPCQTVDKPLTYLCSCIDKNCGAGQVCVSIVMLYVALFGVKGLKLLNKTVTSLDKTPAYNYVSICITDCMCVAFLSLDCLIV